MSDDNLKDAAAQSVAGEGDIRERMRELTLKAIRDRSFDFASMRDLMQQLGEGVAVGAEKRGGDVKEALQSAFRGMDDAFGKSAQAAKLAMEELASKGRDLNDTEIRAALDAMKQMEKDFVATMSSVAGSAGTKVKAEMQELAAHAAKAGTDTGAIVSQTLSEFSRTLSTTTAEATQAGLDAARTLSDRLAQATSGFLAGLSDALARKDDRKDS